MTLKNDIMCNAHLQEAHKARKVLMDNDRDITAENIKNYILGIDDRKMVLEVFQDHNDQDRCACMSSNRQ